MKALQECGVQPLTQYSTVGASTFRGNFSHYPVEVLTFIPSFRFWCYVCVLSHIKYKKKKKIIIGYLLIPGAFADVIAAITPTNLLRRVVL